MAQIPAGSAVIPITVNDQTGAGFNSAKKNLKSFQDSIQQAKGAMLPFSEMLRGGMFAGAGMAGIGALMSDFGSLSSVMQSMTGTLPKVSGGMSQAAGASRELAGGTREAAGGAGSLAESLTLLGARIATIAATGYAMTQAYTSISTIFQTVKASIIDTSTAWVDSHRAMITTVEQLADIQRKQETAQETVTESLLDLGAAQRDAADAANGLTVAENAMATARQNLSALQEEAKDIDFNLAVAHDQLAEAANAARVADAEWAVSLAEYAQQENEAAMATANAAVAAAEKALADQQAAVTAAERAVTDASATVATAERSAADAAAVAITTERMAAEKLLNAAGVTNITTTNLLAARTVMMTNAEAGAVTWKAIFTAQTYKNIAAKIFETRATDGATGAVARASIAAKLSTAANVVMGFSVRTLSLAWIQLNAVMAANPLMAVLMAATLLIPAISALCGWLRSSGDEAAKSTEQLEKNAATMKKWSDAASELYRKQDERASTDSLKLQRLEQLQGVEDKTAAQALEMRKLVHELNRDYKGLNLTYDATTESVRNLTEKTGELMTAQQRTERIKRLQDEYEGLGKTLEKLAAIDYEADKSLTSQERLEKQFENNNQRIEIHEQRENILRQISFIKAGDDTDIIGKSRAEQLKAGIEATDKEQEAARRALEETEKKRREEHARTNDYLDKLREEAQKATQNAMQNEMDAVRKVADERRKKLNELIEERKKAGRMYGEEMEMLRTIDRLLEQQVNRIQEKHAAESQKYIDDYNRAQEERQAAEVQKKTDEQLTKRIALNPMQAVKDIREAITASEKSIEMHRRNVETKTAEALKGDNFIDTEEKADIDSARKVLKEREDTQRRLQTHMADAQQKIQEAVKSMMQQARQSLTPLSHLQAGSAEAQQKFIELQNNANPPEVQAIDDLAAALELQWQREEAEQKRLNDMTEKLYSKIEAV